MAQCCAYDASRSGGVWEANAETWTQHARAGFDIYRDRVNTPAFLQILPPIAGWPGYAARRIAAGLAGRHHAAPAKLDYSYRLHSVVFHNR